MDNSERTAWRIELDTHYRLLLKVENEKARQFYLQEAIDCNWSTRSLDRQIGNMYYERMLMSKNAPEVKEEADQKTYEQTSRECNLNCVSI